MLVSTSTRSPNEYGNGGPFDIAEATADLKNSMATKGTCRERERPEKDRIDCPSATWTSKYLALSVPKAFP
jgi:hypothetical protein